MFTEVIKQIEDKKYDEAIVKLKYYSSSDDEKISKRQIKSGLKDK